MHLEDPPAAGVVGRVDDDAAVEPARAQQRPVEDLRPVRRGQDDHALRPAEPVHLGEDLVQRLLALVVAGELLAGAAGAPDRVELVDEDDRRRLLLGLSEEVAHAAGADADDHLDELGGAQREERDIRLAGDRAGEQRLARAREARTAARLGDRRAEPAILLGALEEVDDLDQLLLGLVDPRHVAELGALLLRRIPAGLRAPDPSEPPARARRMRRKNRPTSRMVGPKPKTIACQSGRGSRRGRALKTTSPRISRSSSSSRSANAGLIVRKREDAGVSGPGASIRRLKMPSIVSPRAVTLRTSPRFTAFRKKL